MEVRLTRHKPQLFKVHHRLQHRWILRAGAGDTEGQILCDSSHMGCPESKTQSRGSLLGSMGLLLGVGCRGSTVEQGTHTQLPRPGHLCRGWTGRWECSAVGAGCGGAGCAMAAGRQLRFPSVSLAVGVCVQVPSPRLTQGLLRGRSVGLGQLRWSPGSAGPLPVPCVPATNILNVTPGNGYDCLGKTGNERKNRPDSCSMDRKTEAGGETALSGG